jgi:hypothetical protein
MEARVDADLGLTGTNARRIDNLLAHAARLRRLYAIDVGAQRAFFELQTDDFALLSIDTGILRTVCDAPFYPRTDHLRAKMDAEMPQWKQPFWYWTKWFNAWPFSIETFFRHLRLQPRTLLPELHGSASRKIKEARCSHPQRRPRPSAVA